MIGMTVLSISEKLVRASGILDPVMPHLLGTQAKSGDRPAAEAFLANAPSLYGHMFSLEQLLVALDIGVSAIEADPRFGGGYAFVSSCIYRLGFEDTDIYSEEALAGAQPWASAAVRVDPECREGWEALTEILCYRGNFKQAEKALGEVFRRWGDGDVYARAAFLFFRLQGDAEQAMNWGALAWQQEWNSLRLVQTLFALGQLYRDNKRFRQAADAYRVLCEHDHDSMWGHHFWARCELALGNPKEAIELNLRAIKLGGGHELREFHEEIKHKLGRFKLGLASAALVEVPAPPALAGKPSAEPSTASPKSQGLAPESAGKSSARHATTKRVGTNSPGTNRPTPGSIVVSAPPAAKVVAAPPPAKIVAAPPPAPGSENETRRLVKPVLPTKKRTTR